MSGILNFTVEMDQTYTKLIQVTPVINIAGVSFLFTAKPNA
jgi:hypothetical protein